MIKIGKKVKQAIIYAGETQTSIAATMNISKSYFSQKVCKQVFSFDELEQIAELLGAEFVAEFRFPDGTKI